MWFLPFVAFWNALTVLLNCCVIVGTIGTVGTIGAVGVGTIGAVGSIGAIGTVVVWTGAFGTVVVWTGVGAIGVVIMINTGAVASIVLN